jgi:protein-S-isoprenylcysteine O-methyltransferase Ste14
MTHPKASPKKSIPSRQFAARGWVLILPLIIVLVARALTPAATAPLKPEWLIYIAAAIALRLWAGAHLGEHGNDARAHAPQLAQTGPYRFSRNPLYVANILAGAGLILYANALPLPVALALIAAIIIHHIVLIRYEEQTLLALHGAAFERYRAHVPRWYGLMRPHGPTSREQESRGLVTWSTILRRQGRNVGYLVACVLLVWVAARV